MNDQVAAAAMMSQQPPPQMMSQPQMMKPVPVMVQSRSVHPHMMNQPHPMMNQRGGYKPWQLQQDPNPNIFPFNNNNNFVPSKPRTKSNWKGKNVKSNAPVASVAASSAVSGGGYKPPSLNDLQTQNRMKARKYYHPKKKFNNRFIPYAPRNTSSFIIRAKKSGGIASLVSPCPVTPAVLPTPIFSPSREVLGDMAKEEWGVDGYGSMKGLIRLRSPGHEADDDDEEGNGSSESDVEEHVEVERRLDHDLSRFEMIYPNYGTGEYGYNNVLENRVDDQDSHIAQLEEENLTLKERLFLMERELGDLRRRLHFLERRQGGRGGGITSMVVEDVNEEVVENVSENDDNESDGGSDVGAHNTGVDTNDDSMEYAGGGNQDNVKEIVDVRMEEIVANDDKATVPNELDTNRGSEFVTNDLVTVADKVKDGETGVGYKVTDVGVFKEGEVKGEVVENKIVEETVVSKEISKNDNDDSVMKQIVQDELQAKKDEPHDQKICAEKSIGGGD